MASFLMLWNTNGFVPCPTRQTYVNYGMSYLAVQVGSFLGPIGWYGCYGVYSTKSPSTSIEGWKGDLVQ